jgi:hypothetical protein
MKKWIASAAIASLLLTTAVPAVAGEQRDSPEFREVGDLLVARPIGAVMTLLGAAAFVVSLPFTAATRSVHQAAHDLVVEPAKETFYRCLGCTDTGALDKNGYAPR